MKKILIKYTIAHTLMMFCLVIASVILSGLFSELAGKSGDITNLTICILIVLSLPWLLYISSRLLGYALYNIRTSWIKAEEDAKK